MPSATSLRYRLHKRSSATRLQAQLGTIADIVIDRASLHVSTRDEAVATVGVQMLAMMDTRTGTVIAHSLHESNPDGADLIALVKSIGWAQPRPRAVLVGTSSVRAELLDRLPELNDLAINVDCQTRIRSGEALIGMFGLRIGRIRLDARRAEAGRRIRHPQVPLDVLDAVVTHVLRTKDASVPGRAS